MKLKGLNVRRNSAGKWYVSLRRTGALLGSAPDRKALDRLMASPAFLEAYTHATQAKTKRSYAAGTLGALIDWYKTRTRYTRLADRTKADYLKAERFLEPCASYAVAEIVKADIVELRDQAAEEHNPAFAGHLLAFMSAVFSEASEAGKMDANPALGVRRLYKANPEANRCWTAAEWQTVLGIAPASLVPVLAIARWAGLRGQDIAVLTWSSYRDDPEMGKVLAFVPRKNGAKVGEMVIGVRAELRAILDPLARGVLPSAPICRNSLGKRFPSENAMRQVWQGFKASEAFTAALPDSGDLTLHGLRVTFSSELREAGFSDREIADMLGDLSESMGKRYARGARMRKTSERVHRAMGNAG